MLDNCDEEDELRVGATPPMLRFSTPSHVNVISGTHSRQCPHHQTSVPLLPPCYVCNSAVIACIMAMVGRGVCGRAPNPTVYIESWESALEALVRAFSILKQ